uniref:Uncharacterized protein n=1 Tax=Oryza glumipatula TaxID=40148 RepID=A0A0E0BRV4_9ORYZ
MRVTFDGSYGMPSSRRPGRDGRGACGSPAAAAPSPPPDPTGAGEEARSWRTVWRCNASDHKPTRAPSLDNPSSGGCGSSCPEFGDSRSGGLRRQQRQIQAQGEWMASPPSSNRLCALPSAVEADLLYGEHVLLLILLLTGLEAPELTEAFREVAPPHLHLLAVVSGSLRALSWSTPLPSFAKDGKCQLGVALAADEVQAARRSSPFPRPPSRTADIVARLCATLRCAPQSAKQEPLSGRRCTRAPACRTTVVPLARRRREMGSRERDLGARVLPFSPVGASSGVGTIGAVH